jgi:asparagine synthetase B (glutamine-hydrolysing)
MQEVEDRIREYAYLGYIVDARKVDQIQMRVFEAMRPSRVTDWKSESNLRRGIESLSSAFPEVDAGIQVVPLSGGLDSRAILAALLRVVPKERLRAATFGCPGTYDYDFGRLVARRAGIESVEFDLSKVEVTRDHLVGALRSGASGATAFDSYYNRLVTERFGEDVTYWSGFGGDAVSGAHGLLPPSRNWAEACDRFVSRNQYSRSLGGQRFGSRPVKQLPESPWLDPGVLTFDEQLDFLIRQQHLIAKVVLPSGYRIRTPFLHPEWLAYMVPQPPEARVGQILYKRVLCRFAPELFRLPTKANLGFGLAATSAGERLRRSLARAAAAARGRNNLAFRRLNYLDFDRAFRERSDYRLLAEEAAGQLQADACTAWLRPREILSEHLEGRVNHGRALLMLVGLALNLEIGTL